MDSCQCYQIGGPWITFDPDCPAHGYEAQRADRQREEELNLLAALHAEVKAWRDRFPEYVYRIQDDGVFLK